jgi:Fe-S cluster assembly iron-binding protein IscA
MLTLTEAAGAHLAELLAEKGCPNDTAVRLVCTDSGDSLILDSHKEGDTGIDHEGRTVLLLDSVASERLDGRKLDVEQAGGGAQLILIGQSAGSG